MYHLQYRSGNKPIQLHLCGLLIQAITAALADKSVGQTGWVLRMKSAFVKRFPINLEINYSVANSGT